MKKTIVIVFTMIIMLVCIACESEGDRKRAVRDHAGSYLSTYYDEYEIEKIEKEQDDSYYVHCNVSVSGKYYDLSESVILNVHEAGDKWYVYKDYEVNNRKIEFHETNEYYYCYSSTNSNYSELFRIIDLNDTLVKVEYYEHSIVSTGWPGSEDSFESGTDELECEYDKENHCITFRYRNATYRYQVYPDRIIEGRDKYKGGQMYTEYKNVSPKNPDDYWWFEEAKNAVSNSNENNDQIQSEGQSGVNQQVTTPISGNTISGSIVDDSEVFCYSYSPVNSGMHRFDLDISDVNSNYEVEIITSKQAIIGSCQYSSRDKGMSVELNAGETYTIKVSYEWQNCDYTINIGEPEPVTTISKTSASGKLDYKDKSNEYLYKAPKTGLYRFDLTIGNAEANYSFKIINSKNEKLLNTTFSKARHQSVNQPGSNVSLTAGETYIIVVSQDNKMCDYSFTIGVPNDVVNVSGNKIQGTIAYIGQENSYIYEAKKTGEYTFYLDISDANSNYEVIIKNSKNATVASQKYTQAAYAKKNAQFTTPMNAGKYTIKVVQDNRLCDYTVEIKTP